jgi:hypothetical protein
MSAIAKISKNVQSIGETGGRSLGLPVFPEKVKQLLQPRSTRGRFTEDGQFIGVSDNWLAVAVSGNSALTKPTPIDSLRV